MVVFGGDADGHRLAAARIERILEQVPDRLLERVGVDQRLGTGVPEQADFAVAALAGDGGVEDWPQRLRLYPLHAAGGLGGKPCEELVHLADRRFQRRHHIGPELGIVGVALGVARKQRQLADQILDVMENEGEATVELLEPLGLAQCLLTERLGERACGLVARGAQQVEILPVELALEFGRGEDNHADEALVMKQGNGGPGALLVD